MTELGHVPVTYKWRIVNARSTFAESLIHSPSFPGDNRLWKLSIATRDEHGRRLKESQLFITVNDPTSLAVR